MNLFKTDTFPSTREYIGTVYTPFNGEHKMYMPNLRDLRDIDLSDSDGVYKLAARSINIPEEDFMQWPMADAMAVADHMADALKKLRPSIVKEKR